MAQAQNSQDQQNFIVFGAVTTFRYTNHKGETEMRVIIPHCLRFGQGGYDAEDQWLLECYDMDREGLWTLSLKNVHPR